MSVFKGLQPEIVWSQFEEICKIPRPSGKEEKIIQYVLNFAKKHSLKSQKDETGNVLIKKPATAGMEKVKTVILQCHLDMVCEKNSDTKHDFDKDPITPLIDGEWVKAKGTTLGADDGIGIATALAILSSNDIQHGPLECLFTVDEETGLNGAINLKKHFLNGNILINLDSEDIGEICIGCAGGITTTARFKLKKDKAHANAIGIKLSVTGLRGGHSGEDINKRHGNSIKILNRLLWYLTRKFDAMIFDFDGGDKHNAIPRESFATIAIKKKNLEDFEKYMRSFIEEINNEYKSFEPNILIKIDHTNLPKTVLKSNLQKRLIKAIYACPHGVLAMSNRIPGMVETSTNLAAIKFDRKEKEIIITTSQRSEIESARDDAAMMVKNTFKLSKAEVEHNTGYPGWAPNEKSEVLSIAKQAYIEIFKKEPYVKTIHAGLECGIILKKYPGMDAISIGPTMRQVHSPDEKLEIESVTKFWIFLTRILANIK